MARLTIKDVPNHKLETLAEYFGFKQAEAHRALADVWATLFILHKITSQQDELCTSLRPVIQKYICKSILDPKSIEKALNEEEGDLKEKLQGRTVPTVKELRDWLFYGDYSGIFRLYDKAKNADDEVKFYKINRNLDLEGVDYGSVRHLAFDYSNALREGNDEAAEYYGRELAQYMPNKRLRYCHWARMLTKSEINSLELGAI